MEAEYILRIERFTHYSQNRMILDDSSISIRKIGHVYHTCRFFRFIILKDPKFFFFLLLLLHQLAETGIAAAIAAASASRNWNCGRSCLTTKQG